MTALRFAAFVSYSHAIDGRLAPTPQHALQTTGERELDDDYRDAIREPGRAHLLACGHVDSGAATGHNTTTVFDIEAVSAAAPARWILRRAEAATPG